MHSTGHSVPRRSVHSGLRQKEESTALSAPALLQQTASQWSASQMNMQLVGERAYL